MTGERTSEPCDDIRSWFSALNPPMMIEEALAHRDLRLGDQDEDLLIDLIDSEIHHRRKQGEQPSLKEYRGRFPHLSVRLFPFFRVSRR
jgi:hypothetical protein